MGKIYLGYKRKIQFKFLKYFDANSFCGDLKII